LNLNADRVTKRVKERKIIDTTHLIESFPDADEEKPAAFLQKPFGLPEDFREGCFRKEGIKT
jgi:hypothetical protein